MTDAIRVLVDRLSVGNLYTLMHCRNPLEVRLESDSLNFEFFCTVCWQKFSVKYLQNLIKLKNKLSNIEITSNEIKRDSIEQELIAFQEFRGDYANG